MSVLYQRKVKLIVAYPVSEDYRSVSTNIVEIEDLRVEFKIRKSLGKDPNTAEISITNLSEQTRGALPTKGAKVILQAGYTDGIAQIFIGDSTHLTHVQEGPNWITKILCGDGERGFSFGRVSESFAPGTQVGDVVKSLSEKTGLDLGNALEQAGNVAGQVYSNGYTAHGKAIPELEKALKFAGYELSIQDGALQILKPGEALLETVELSPDTGLVGSPETQAPEKKGQPAKLKARSLLQAKIKPGGRVSLSGVRHAGSFKVDSVEHAGDTAGGDWYSPFEAVPL